MIDLLTVPPFFSDIEAGTQETVASAYRQTPQVRFFRPMRVFWALVMGFVAIVLLTVGEDSVESLQSFIVVTAVPVSLLMLTTYWTAPRAAQELAKEQLPRTVGESAESPIFKDGN